jgi:PilZ domain
MNKPIDPIRRRDGSRRRCPPTTARLLVAGEPEGLAARVTDLSFVGAGLELPRALEPGTELTILLPSLCENFALVVMARVVHRVALARGLWRVGCQFPEVVARGFLEQVAWE